VVALFVALYVLPLAWRPLLLPDEFRYAEIPREMLASGDWVVPRLNGFLYFEKPVLGYWLTAASEALFGHNRFAVRLPSALATGLTALLLAFLVRRRVGKEADATAWLAALVFLSCLLAAAVGSTAVLDAPLTLFVTATLVFFYLATAEAPSSRREGSFLLLSGVACGLAFLTKGFLILALTALVAGGYLAWQRRWRDLFRLPWLPAVAALAVAAPWSLAVHLRAPDFWHFFFWHEHVQRFFEQSAGQHPQPWWFFLAATPAVLLPWTFFLPAAAAGYRGSGRQNLAAAPPLRDLARYCAVWVAMTYLFFSASSGKLLTYVLPALPALAILVAIGLAAPGGAPRAWRRGGLVGAAFFALLAGACAFVLLFRPQVLPLPPGAREWSLVVAIASLAVVLAVAAAAKQGDRGRTLAAWALVPLLLTVQLALPSRVLQSKAPGSFLAQHRDLVGADTVVLADSNGVRAACWVFQRDDVVILGSPGELRYGVEQDPSQARWLDVGEARQLIEEHRGNVVLFVENRRYTEWQPLLPTPSSVDSQSRHGWVFVTY